MVVNGSPGWTRIRGDSELTPVRSQPAARSDARPPAGSNRTAWAKARDGSLGAVLGRRRRKDSGSRHQERSRQETSLEGEGQGQSAHPKVILLGLVPAGAQFGASARIRELKWWPLIGQSLSLDILYVIFRDGELLGDFQARSRDGLAAILGFDKRAEDGLTAVDREGTVELFVRHPVNSWAECGRLTWSMLFHRHGTEARFTWFSDRFAKIGHLFR